MLRHVFVSLFFIHFAAQLAAESPVPERRVIITRDVDFYGSDLTAIFDTSFDACQKACLSTPECRAFTYNTKSNSCFPKSAVSNEKPFEGARSGRIAVTSPQVLAQASARAGDLGFLGESGLTRALEQAEKIGRLHPSGSWDIETMISAAHDREANGDMLNAMRW